MCTGSVYTNMLRFFDVAIAGNSDGVLTPAISVVSAIEGLQYQTGISNGALGLAFGVGVPGLSARAAVSVSKFPPAAVVMGVSMAILVLLFLMQSFGTQRVAFLFSPIMFLWFVVNAVLGTSVNRGLQVSSNRGAAACSDANLGSGWMCRNLQHLQEWGGLFQSLVPQLHLLLLELRLLHGLVSDRQAW